MKKTKIFFTALFISVATAALPVSSTLAASQYMDFFEPTSIVGSLSMTAWDTSHVTSVDGINNWILQPGYAYYPTADFIRYTNNTVNHYTKLERPSVYMENGHVVAMTFSAMDVEKWQDVGNDQHGSKIIVVPFGGIGLDSAISSSSVGSYAPVALVASKGSGADGIWELLCLGLGTIFFALNIRQYSPNN